MRKVANASGGAAAAGGFDFHAALGAVAYVHVLRGSPLPWTDDWTASPPTAVSFETAGPGDDISITLSDGTALDVQVKKGTHCDEEVLVFPRIPLRRHQRRTM